ncbi:MAG: TAXI family TRAP transporter solute-binding subunit [Pseudomonadota bacterium]|nr:TAXI family TRAP transporter solute-binding subunit [Pseudomonadota bacterium]
MNKMLKATAVCGAMIAAMPAMANDYFSIGAMPVGGTAYQWAAGIADIIARDDATIETSAEATKGLVENMRLMIDGEIEVGVVNSAMERNAYDATGDYEGGETGKVLGWLSLVSSAMHIFTLEGSGIESDDDLVGKRVGIGQPGGSALQDSLIHLETIGMTPGEDFDEFQVSVVQQVDMIANGQLDAGMWTGVLPLVNLSQLASQHEVRLVPIPQEVIDTITTEYPWYAPMTIPGGTYPTEPNDIDSYAISINLDIGTEVSEDVVYRATKAVFENIEDLRMVHPALADYQLEDVLSGVSIPLHPGAQRYYEEIELPGLEEFLARVGGAS